jgi:hypothetical protein
LEIGDGREVFPGLEIGVLFGGEVFARAFNNLGFLGE